MKLSHGKAATHKMGRGSPFADVQRAIYPQSIRYFFKTSGECEAQKAATCE
jgi:gluconate kinase